MLETAELTETRPAVEAIETPSRPMWSERMVSGGRRLLMLAGAIAVLKAMSPNAAEAQYEPEPTPAGYETGAVGQHTLAVIPVDFKGGPNSRLKFSRASIDRAVFDGPDSVSDYYSTVSFGQLQLTGKVFEPVTVSPFLEGTNCNNHYFQEIGKAANQKVEQRVGADDLESYSNYLYVFPRQTNCINGNVPKVLNGNTIGNAAFINSRDVQHKGVYVHELGHELGLSHADSIRCSTRDNHTPFTAPLGRTLMVVSECSEHVYQDPFDPMGFAARRKSTPIDFDAFDKARAGWLQPDNIQTVTRSTTIDVAPDELPSSQTQLVRIPFGNEFQGRYSQFVYLDARQPVGEDAKVTPNLPVAQMFGGVAIREGLGQIGYGGPIILGRDTYLIDAQPQTRTMTDAVLTPGNSYHDPRTGMTIKTLGITPDGAEVRIKLPAVNR